MTFHEIFILSVFDLLITILLLKTICKNLSINIYRKIVYIIGGALTIGASSYILTNNIISHIGSTVLAFIWFMILIRKKEKINFPSKITVFFFISILIFIVQLISITIVSRTIEGFRYTFYYGLISQSMAMLITIIIWRFFSFAKIYNLIQEGNVFFRIVTTNVFILYYILTISWFEDAKNITESIIGIIFIILVTIFINVVFFRESMINKSYKEKLKIYETYIPIIDSTMEELRKKQHDFNTHMYTIKTMNEKLPEELKEYINEIEKDDIWKELLKLHNKVIMALLYSKYTLAKDKNINLKIKTNNYFLKSKYSIYELVEMYGILIDNAIEATQGHKDKKSIEILLDKREKKNIFRITNSYKYISVSEINKFFYNGYSTKSDTNNSGIGLNKLKKLIDSKKGNIECYYNKDIESVVVEIEHY